MNPKYFVKVLLGDKRYTDRVSTEECDYVADFKEAIKKKFSPILDSYAIAQLTLFESDGTTEIGLKTKMENVIVADGEELIVTVATDVSKEVVSMAYGKADISFISEATGIQEDTQVWEEIPIDGSVVPSDEFVELFKKNCSVFEFEAEASRRTVIDLFLREIVSLFPAFQVICEYHMTLVNQQKRRRLNGKCDYTICHRGHRNLPHLVAIEAKVTNKETMLQCIGECASIHYTRKLRGLSNVVVYGIHSTGSVWKFIFVDENGGVSVSGEKRLNVEHYVKEEFDLIYRLIYFVIQQSFANSPRTSPNVSITNIAQ